MFENELQTYEQVRKEYEQKVISRMDAKDYREYREYLHPFRDGNGRTGRLLSNYILQRQGHPLLTIRLDERPQYISALRAIRTEGTDEHLIALFIKLATTHMQEELSQKHNNSRPVMFLF